MKTIKSFVGTALLMCLLFAQCKTDQKQSEKTPKTAQPVANEFAPDQYFRLQGTVGDQPVTVHLVGKRQPSAVDLMLSGYYSYDKSTEPISLFAQQDSVGNLVFEEAYDGNEPNKITGKMAADGSFTGTWSDPSGKKQFPVSWKPAAGGLALKGLFFIDSLSGKPGIKDAPQATCEQNWLVPTEATEAGLKTFLDNEIRLGMIGDSLGRLAKTPAEAFDLGKKDLFAGYQEEANAWDPADSNASVIMYMRDRMSSMQVFFNENNLLTLGFMEYSYTGGAHGNYGTAVRSYDLAAKKVIKLDDVFKPGYQKKLTTALNKNARRKFGLKPNASLEGVLFEKSIKLNDNFGLTSKGIFFNYVPYEIASYAQGEIQIFVPFEEIKDILK